MSNSITNLHRDNPEDMLPRMRQIAFSCRELGQFLHPDRIGKDMAVVSYELGLVLARVEGRNATLRTLVPHALRVGDDDLWTEIKASIKVMLNEMEFAKETLAAINQHIKIGPAA